MKAGLLGRKLGHSYSPQIHTYLGNYRYTLFEREPDEVEDFVKSGDFHAINVTIPYKKTVIPFCQLTETARKMGSVNTLVRQEDGTIIGHNTDSFGFTSMIQRSSLSPRGKKCLVLGSGGASVTAVAVLKEMGADVVIISRNGENHYSNLHLHRDAAIICNCTPVGMYPQNGESPIDLDLFPHLEGVLDMIYNPARTKLLLDAEKRGLVYTNGLWMLVAQAKESSEWFQNKSLPDSIVEEVYRKMRMQMENIILIGMPGCGKSTIGKELATALGRPFADADEWIEDTYHCTIPEIFASEGEAGFREKETRILRTLGKQSGTVIATGGGCITREANYSELHQNGTIFWLQRDMDKLATDGRPLSQTHSLTDLYALRRPLYAQFADHIIDNNGSPEETVKKILAVLEAGI